MQEPGVVNDFKETYFLDKAGQLHTRTLSSCGSIHKTGKPKTDHIQRGKRSWAHRSTRTTELLAIYYSMEEGEAIYSKSVTPS